MSKKRGAHTKAALKGQPYHQYTEPERESILHIFDTEYHGGNITQFVPTRGGLNCHSETGQKRG